MVYPERDIKTVPLGSGRCYIILSESDTIPSEEELVKLCIPANLAGETKGGATLTYSVAMHKESDDHGTLTREAPNDEDAKLSLGLFSWCLDTAEKLIRTGRIVRSKDGRFKTLKIGGLDNDDGKQYIVIFKHTDKKYSPLYAAMIGNNGAGLSIPFARDKVSTLQPEFSGVPSDESGTLIHLFEDLGEQPAASNAGDEAQSTAGEGTDPNT